MNQIVNFDAMMDSQAALGFVTHQRSHIESEVLKKEYPEVRYSQLVPVDTSANPFAPSVTHFTQDATGRAKFVNGKGDDVPLVNLMQTKHEQTVNMGGIGYSFSLEEIGAAQMLNQSLSMEGAMAAREDYERFVDQITLVGGNGIEGLFNTTGITTVAAASTIAASNAEEILALINGEITSVYASTNGVERPNTVVMPLAQYGDIVTRRIGPDTSQRIYDFLVQGNVYTAATGQPLTIIGSHHLTDKMVIYRRDPQAVKMHMPMPLRFIPPQFVNFEIKTLGMFRFAPVSIRRPSAFRYVTGV